MSFPCACAFSFQSFNFVKYFDFFFINMILFSKIMRFCAVQNSMKITLDKKFRTESKKLLKKQKTRS